MRDAISRPLDLAFLVVALIVMFSVAINPRRVFAIFNSYTRAKVPSDAVFTSIRIVAGFCAVGVAGLLLVHFFRGR